ncbi:MAG: hypothetical protein C7B46_03425 [Sulfobacillus benefaciens]|uniref:Uncharacterized protein n=1 Tax=Sulfobacillus benefaciens TaxID=453960 RepID=A0A2T2XJV1_9FIRM|nr:MAG: hypothetical protein C7B46_03425 [Sulfobacillus benefaciens]
MKPVQSMKFTTMLLRTAFLLALLLGLGDLFKIWAETPVLVDAHIIAGLLVLGSMWTLAVQAGKVASGAGGPLWVAGFVVLVGAVIALFMRISGNLWGILHLVLMLIAMGMAEMGIARSKRKATVR